MEEKYIVYEINEEELKEAAGGDRLPHYDLGLCYECHKNIGSVKGFIIKDEAGKILEFKYTKGLCESCAQKDVDLYLNFGWEFVSWIS